MQTSNIAVGGAHLQVAQRGTGQPLLLVHGFPLDHSMWRGQLEGLSDECHVIAPDLRGFGKSGGGGDHVWRMEQYADDLARLLDAMRIERPVVLCGLSMGGYIAWQFWSRHRSRLARLILCDTRSAADQADAARARQTLAARVTSDGMGPVVEQMQPKLFAPETVHQQPEVVEATRAVMLAAPPQGVAAALRGMAERPDMTPILRQIDVPTLVICGQHDQISPPAEMQAIARAIPGAEFELITLAGHMTPLEQPEQVNGAIRRFLKTRHPG